LVQVLTALGVEPSSPSITAVRSAYRKAALRFHPDRLSAAGALERSYKSDVWKLLSSKMDAYAP
jgi:curved DNA-binding protein CbpA